MTRLLVIDDEHGIRSALRQVFEYEGHEVRVAEDGHEGLEMAADFNPDVIFLDVKMPGMDGLEVLEKLREQDMSSIVVMISGHGTIDTAVHATRKGAYDFLEKPLDTDRLLVTLRRALELRGLTQSVTDLRNQIESRYEIVGTSYPIRQVLERIERVGPTEARVLVTGENGTGKELVAHQLHEKSLRNDKPFIELNCAAIPSELIESELFGHLKGSFTSAIRDHSGKFEKANNGTLFLDEIADMSLNAQAKVLRALEENKIQKVGGSKDIMVDVRVIAATNKDLDQEIKNGKFREDLYHRLAVILIEVPPLNKRKDDIPILANYFLKTISEEQGVEVKNLSGKAIERLTKYSWTGNVRELRNVIERLIILGNNPITDEDINQYATK